MDEWISIDEWDESFSSFLNKGNITKKWNIHCFLYHKAQLQYLSAITMSSFVHPYTTTSAPPQYRRCINKLHHIHWRVAKSVTVAMWEGAGWAGSVWRRVRFVTLRAEQYPWGGCCNDRARLLLVLHGGMLDSQKVYGETRKMQSDYKEKLFAHRHSSRLPRILSSN